MHQYQNLLHQILTYGVDDEDRTGVGTRSIFGAQLRFDLRAGFPLVTTKRVPLRAVIVELLWMLAGRTDNQWLNERGVHIWDPWATAEQCARFGRAAGDLGPIYGAAFRNFGATPVSDGVDQIARLVQDLKTTPTSRRLIVSAWDPREVDKVTLPPCHCFFQCYARNGELSLQLYQRSADMFIGVPFNIAAYSLLTLMLAQVTGLRAREFVHTFGDAHIYKNHFMAVEQQLAREPRALPSIEIDTRVQDIFAFQPEHFSLSAYDPWPALQASVAV